MISNKVEILDWPTFQQEIAPLWGHSDPQTIPIVNNPYRVIGIPFREWPTKILHFAYRYYENDELVGLTSLYNVSLDTVRVRGIYTLPEHRGRGVGHRMIHRGMSELFPGFFRLVGFFREENIERYKKHSDMQEFPGVDWLWSSYQNIRIRMLYREYFPRVETPLMSNARRIATLLPRHGFGGKFNLDRSFTSQEWHDYAWADATNYPDGGIDLSR